MDTAINSIYFDHLRTGLSASSFILEFFPVAPLSFILGFCRWVNWLLQCKYRFLLEEGEQLRDSDFEDIVYCFPELTLTWLLSHYIVFYPFYISLFTHFGFQHYNGVVNAFICLRLIWIPDYVKCILLLNMLYTSIFPS